MAIFDRPTTSQDVSMAGFWGIIFVVYIFIIYHRTKDPKLSFKQNKKVILKKILQGTMRGLKILLAVVGFAILMCLEIGFVAGGIWIIAGLSATTIIIILLILILLK